MKKSNNYTKQTVMTWVKVNWKQSKNVTEFFNLERVVFSTLKNGIELVNYINPDTKQIILSSLYE